MSSVLHEDAEQGGGRAVVVIPGRAASPANWAASAKSTRARRVAEPCIVLLAVGTAGRHRPDAAAIGLLPDQIRIDPTRASVVLPTAGASRAIMPGAANIVKGTTLVVGGDNLRVAEAVRAIVPISCRTITLPAHRAPPVKPGAARRIAKPDID